VDQRNIKSVTFHIHPSFRVPKVFVQNSPFIISQIGWGIFDIKTEVEFHYHGKAEFIIPLQFKLKEAFTNEVVVHPPLPISLVAAPIPVPFPALAPAPVPALVPAPISASVTAAAPAPAPVPGEDGDSKECVVCLEGVKSHVVVPCGHLCLCDTCSQKFQKGNCPLCRQAVTMILKVYS